MSRLLHVVVVTAAVLKPLDALSADFVVWWEKGVLSAGYPGGRGDYRRLRA